MHPDRDPEHGRPIVPSFADDALIFTLSDADSVRHAVDNFYGRRRERAGLEAVLEYVERHRGQGAELTPLYAERAEQVHGGDGKSGGIRGWRLAEPNRISRWHALSAYHYLQMVPSDPALFVEHARLEASLRRDPRISFVYHPAVPFAWDPPAERDKEELGPRWGQEKCGFPDAWEHLENKGFDPGPIGVIDQGPNLHHPDLHGRVEEFGVLQGTGSGLAHASGVAGVLSARRDNHIGIDGCCSANVHLYNVATPRGVDPKAFILALKAVACKGLRVVNVSLFMARDPCVEDQVRECVANGMVIVAAMGNDGKEVLVYPAAYPGVIAVGATHRKDEKLGASNTGTHVWLSAPGEYIHTISGPDALQDQHGTSYAAPMVSAAAWLALRMRPYWSPRQIKRLLAKSVHRTGQYDKEIGHGRLDMQAMLRELAC